MTVEAITSELGGARTLRREVGTPVELAALTREGMPSGVIAELAQGLAIDRRRVARAIGITERTLSRRLNSHARLSSLESDRSVRLARVVALTVEVFGERDRAARWLQAPNRALDGRTPFELLDTDTGVQEVETILGRIDHGIYS